MASINCRSETASNSSNPQTGGEPGVVHMYIDPPNRRLAAFTAAPIWFRSVTSRATGTIRAAARSTSDPMPPEPPPLISFSTPPPVKPGDRVFCRYRRA